MYETAVKGEVKHFTPSLRGRKVISAHAAKGCPIKLRRSPPRAIRVARLQRVTELLSNTGRLSLLQLSNKALL